MITEDRLMVFISSAIEELREERKTVRQAIDSLPIVRSWAFEESPAFPDLEESYLQRVKDCSLFVLIIGRDISDPVRLEYDTAMLAAKPCFVFLRKNAQNEQAKTFIRGLSAKWDWFEELDDLQSKVQAAICDYLIVSYRKLQVSLREVASLAQHLDDLRAITKDPFTSSEFRFGASFALDRSAAEVHMRKWMREHEGAIKDLSKDAKVIKFQDMFLPYWVFRYEAQTFWKATDRWHYYEFGDTSSGVLPSKGDLMVFAGEPSDLGGEFLPQPIGLRSNSRSKRRRQFATDTLKRHRFRRLVPLDGLVTSPSLCVQPTLSKEHARQLAEKHIRDTSSQQVMDRFRKLLSSDTSIDFAGDIYVYLPVWLVAYEYRRSQHRVVIDGVTGDIVVGEAPVNWIYVGIERIIAWVCGAK